MNTCDTCKWWKAPPETQKDDENCWRCLHPKLSPPNTYSEDRAAAPWGIYTAPKFGCIHHEPK